LHDLRASQWDHYRRIIDHYDFHLLYSIDLSGFRCDSDNDIQKFGIQIVFVARCNVDCAALQVGTVEFVATLIVDQRPAAFVCYDVQAATIAPWSTACCNSRSIMCYCAVSTP